MQTLMMVVEFQKAYLKPVRYVPTMPPEEEKELCYNLIHEELEEFKDALAADDIVEAFDALLDLQYVIDVAMAVMGFTMLKKKGFDEVHRSNMSKLGADGKPIYREDGKILKGPNYSPPDLKTMVDNYVEHYQRIAAKKEE